MKSTLEERRIENIKKRHARHGMARAHAARDERNAILAELRALPIKKLRAIAKAAQRAFKSNEKCPSVGATEQDHE
jgi:hypothetical protein